MGVWALLFGTVIIAAVAGIIYLSLSFTKFALLKRIAGEKRSKRLLIGLIPVVMIALVLYLWMGMTNTMIVIIFLMVFWLLSDFIFSCIKKKRKQEWKHYWAGGVALLVTVIHFAAGWYFAHHVWETTYELDTDKQVGNLRIVQITDSHIGATFDGNGFAEHVKEIAKTNPDVVVITGDFVDDGTKWVDLVAAADALSLLTPKYGTYFVFGNHDKGYYSAARRGYSARDLVYELEKNGVVVLEDESVLIDDRFYIIGRQDRSEERGQGGRASMDELVTALDKDKYMIVLDHQPNDYANEAKAGVDLVLSGHTHGGQMIPINLFSTNLGGNDRAYGYEKRDNTEFIVSSGIADWEIKFKTGTISEFVVIDLKEK